MENCAEIRGLRVSFNNEEVLHGISADIPREGISVLIGRSGSGKTTLLRALNRLNENFHGYSGSGEVRLFIEGGMKSIYGGGAPELTAIRRRVGMVFQNPNPLPLSLKKNITLPLELTLGLRRAEAEERMEKSLREVGLWDEVKERLNRHAASFSGGQQQRICLARALALEPDILLLDEPTASLDKKSAELIEALLAELRRAIPLLMVSHSLAQARRLGARFFVMSEGRIVSRVEAESLPDGGEAEPFLEALL
ncbi:MAG: phosphate ABC transporter ATP-binding protein [Synergistaceae bacterium]|nr:phosphate ABC transporter ATP-binding protein [Synergistaceae bacterium]